MGENICRQSNWQEINLQNIQTVHVVQYQKNKQHNKKMGRKYKHTFLQRKHTDGLEACKKMLNVTIIQFSSVKSKLQWDITSHQSGWPSSKNLQAINAGKGVEKGEPSYTVGGNV